jgi:phosphate starvation-inducible PhoH-like protein
MPKRRSARAVEREVTREQNRAQVTFEFLTEKQKLAWDEYQKNEVLFLTGPAGTGKTFLAMAFAIRDVLEKRRTNIILTRPIVEAGESLGFLPGDLTEKVNPYMVPLYDCYHTLCPGHTIKNKVIEQAFEVAPLAFMRGRAEPLDALIMTPQGHKRMGDIKVGDKVIGSDGLSINVIGVFPQGKKLIYEVIFNDKTSVKCSGDHLWSTITLDEKHHNKGYSVKTTLEIAKRIKNKHNQKIHKIPILTHPVQYKSQEIILDPYVLGVLLGDGHLGKHACYLCSSDNEIVARCNTRLPQGVCIKYNKGYDYRLVNITRTKTSIMLELLRSMNLAGKKSYEKFIPEAYKINSVEVRLEILRGLMDTDGWICTHRSGNTRIQYGSTSKQLADDVMFLVRSLGGYAYCNKREYNENDTHLLRGHVVRHMRPSYQVDIMLPFNPFRLARKANQYVNNQRPAKLISDIVLLQEEECQCIQVDSIDHLYVTSDFILTHNTFSDAVCIFDEAQNATPVQLKLFLSRFGKNSKIIVTGDPGQSDLQNKTGLAKVISKLQGLNGVGFVQFFREDVVRHSLISAILERLE